MAHRTVFTENAPYPGGPYHQAVWAGNALFVSGQIAVDPSSGKLVLDTIEAETEQVILNIRAILAEAGLMLSDVVKSSVFVANMDDYDRINKVYARYFEADAAPARELVEVRRLPRDVHLEISVIAIKKET